jgi:plastocyanin
MRRALLAIATAGMLLGTACSSGASAGLGEAPKKISGEPVATNRVDLPKSYRFVPAVIEVSKGTVVTWTNHDDFPHTVRLHDGSGVNKHIAVGKSVSIAFERGGVFAYDCSLHPAQMRGKVIVSDHERR